MTIARWIFRNGLEYLIAALLVVIVGLALIQVTYRYGLSRPISWVEEVARLLLVWAVCLGAAAAVKNNAHLRIDFIANAGGALWRRVTSTFADLVVGGVAVGMLVYGREFFLLTAGDHSTSLGYARNLYYLPVAVAGGLILVFALARIIVPRFFERNAVIDKTEEAEKKEIAQ